MRPVPGVCRSNAARRGYRRWVAGASAPLVPGLDGRAASRSRRSSHLADFRRKFSVPEFEESLLVRTDLVEVEMVHAGVDCIAGRS